MIRDGHADPNADAHQMCIDAHLRHISTYNAKKSSHDTLALFLQFIGPRAPVDQYKMHITVGNDRNRIFLSIEASDSGLEERFLLQIPTFG